MLQVNKKQTDVIKELRKNGINTYPAEFSFAVNGVTSSKRAEQLIKEANKIIDGWEREVNKICKN